MKSFNYNETLSVEGKTVTIRPVYPDDLEKLVLRCWPEMEIIRKLFGEQEILGFAAWENNNRCVAQLHCYSLEMDRRKSALWPVWNNWWDECSEKIKQDINIAPDGRIWCHACFHVGRTQQTCLDELTELILKITKQVGTETDMIMQELYRLCVLHVKPQIVKAILKKYPDEQYTPANKDEFERKYQGKGIGTALCRASIRWAESEGYSFIMGLGGEPDNYELADRFGCLSLRTYGRLGFAILDVRSGPGDNVVMSKQLS